MGRGDVAGQTGDPRAASPGGGQWLGNREAARDTSRPGGVVGADCALLPLQGPQPSLSLAEQHLESPVPSAPGALAGGPTQAAPGVRGEEEQWAREIGAQLRRMADDLNAQYERRVSAGGGVDGRWDFPPEEGAAGRPRQMCGSCYPTRLGRAGDRQVGVSGGVSRSRRAAPGPSDAAGTAGARVRARARAGAREPGRREEQRRARGPRPRGLRAALGCAAHISRAIYSR
ncbi:hypothetical protein P7K49_034682 [Saguinus oedipus]|uniref:Uncharacterized protein n=1 Tax=Saguinus oedipus TaxID=9490 RepID=A0ABQ9TVE4_SAGOE|nr:hypothetical protein P7K49_034682 [Saguinus oedipus]